MIIVQHLETSCTSTPIQLQVRAVLQAALREHRHRAGPPCPACSPTAPANYFVDMTAGLF
jgi:hypothetical protein